jgi:hypothetical protein
MKRSLRSVGLALAVLLPLAVCAPARSDPPTRPNPPPAPKPPPERTGLPKYYHQLDLTPEQVDKVHKVSERFDGKIKDLTTRLEASRRLRVPGSATVTLSLISGIKKLTTQRHEALVEILTAEQCNQLDMLWEAEKK